jgi:hypothetical protein
MNISDYRDIGLIFSALILMDILRLVPAMFGVSWDLSDYVKQELVMLPISTENAVELESPSPVDNVLEESIPLEEDDEDMWITESDINPSPSEQALWQRESPSQSLANSREEE